MSCAVLGGARGLEAQISPGELSAPHRDLEGSRRCLDCHSSSGVEAERCLACHGALGERIAAGRGLHSQRGYERCETCHQEHHGRAFEIVWWGEKGMAAFDHRLAGWPLDGAHAKVGCRECHDPSKTRVEAAAGSSMDPSRTFLGLDPGCGSCHAGRHDEELAGAHLELACAACHDGSRARSPAALLVDADRGSAGPRAGEAACSSCHDDVHAGQFGERGCTSCHDQRAWKPAAAFSHARTRFPLTGSHARASCAGCHRPPGAALPVRFGDVANAGCADCHDDPHAGRLGAECSTCHGSDGWSRLARSFDHGLTRYPLLGRHAEASCAACHGEGHRAPRPASALCSDCHRDVHLGRLGSREAAGDCAACHRVEGFTPARFSIEDHQGSRFALDRAHLAVPCFACHGGPGVTAPHLSETFLDEAGLRFAFEPLVCEACHEDPHDLPVDDGGERPACADCHGTAGWEGIAFDHATTGWALLGGHLRQACEACHAPASAAAGAPHFAALGRECGDCHDDVHAGQFAVAPVLECASCHGEEAWRAVTFDHASTRFPLTGAHAGVQCAACHAGERGAPGVFRPTPLECEACHGSGARR